MAAVPCPYCYHRIDDSALAFQCTGVGAPGVEGCRRAPDPERARHTGFVGDVHPTFVPTRSLRSATQAECPHCHGRTGVRACPVCHTPLPTTFVGSRSPLVGMVGGKGAGKTVYLTVLNHQLRTVVRRRFDADVRLVGDRQGGETSTEEYLARYQRALFEDGELFESTPAARESRKEPLVVEWRSPRRGLLGRTSLRTTILSFYDTAGEDLTSQESVHTQAYLGSADGMIVLLDPWHLPGVRDRLDVPDAAVTGADGPLDVLMRVTELLRATGGVKAHRAVTTPIAVAFAKMDALFPILGTSDPIFAPVRPGAGYDDEAGEAVHEYVASLLHRFDADDVDAHLRLNYRTFRYFAVSALGAPPDYKVKQVDPGGVQPFRVEEPLLWLLHRLGVVDRSRP